MPTAQEVANITCTLFAAWCPPRDQKRCGDKSRISVGLGIPSAPKHLRAPPRAHCARSQLGPDAVPVLRRSRTASYL